MAARRGRLPSVIGPGQPLLVRSRSVEAGRKQVTFGDPAAPSLGTCRRRPPPRARSLAAPGWSAAGARAALSIPTRRPGPTPPSAATRPVAGSGSASSSSSGTGGPARNAAGSGARSPTSGTGGSAARTTRPTSASSATRATPARRRARRSSASLTQKGLSRSSAPLQKGFSNVIIVRGWL